MDSITSEETAMKNMTPIYKVLLSATVAAVVTILPADAAQVEQIEDLNLHSFQPAAGSSTLWKLGIGFDSGDGMALFKWDIADAAFSNVLNTVFFTIIENANPPANGDGSFSVHQMIVDWSESSTTNDFGDGLPQPGVHYRALPVTTGGFNKEALGIGGAPPGNRDDIDLNALVNWWKDNPSQNFGIALVPRGQLNANYPVTFDVEKKGQSREVFPGSIDANDQRLDMTSSGVQPAATRIEASDDTAIAQGVPDNMQRRNFSSTSLFPNSGQVSHSLYRFDFGGLFLDGGNPADFDFSSATFNLPFRTTGNGGDEGTIDVHEMLVPWAEATVSWNQFGAGGPQSGVDYVGTPVTNAAFVGGTTTSVSFDLTALANKWLDDQADNHGVILILTSTTGAWADNIAPAASETNLGWFNAAEDPHLDIEIAVIIDQPDITIVAVGDESAIEIQSQASINYRLESRTGANPFADTGGRLTGNGDLMQFFDPNGFDAGNDYRVIAQ
jgi:hypothetical protein